MKNIDVDLIAFAALVLALFLMIVFRSSFFDFQQKCKRVLIGEKLELGEKCYPD